MIDLSTNYLGLKLRSPLVASASPLSRDIDGIRRLEDAGASAVVLYSLFEEQLRQEEADLNYHLAAGTESFAESLTYFPQASEFHTGPEGYLDHIRKAKAAVDIPIIASLNGSTLGGWTKFAGEIEHAGADAIECNIYYIPTDPKLSAADIEKTYLDIVRAVKCDGHDSGRGQAEPVLQQPRRIWRSASTRRAPTGWCSSIASISRTSIWKNWKSDPTFC